MLGGQKLCNCTVRRISTFERSPVEFLRPATGANWPLHGGRVGGELVVPSPLESRHSRGGVSSPSPRALRIWPTSGGHEALSALPIATRSPNVLNTIPPTHLVSSFARHSAPFAIRLCSSPPAVLAVASPGRRHSSGTWSPRHRPRLFDGVHEPSIALKYHASSPLDSCIFDVDDVDSRTASSDRSYSRPLSISVLFIARESRANHCTSQRDILSRQPTRGARSAIQHWGIPRPAATGVEPN